MTSVEADPDMGNSVPFGGQRPCCGSDFTIVGVGKAVQGCPVVYRKATGPRFDVVDVRTSALPGRINAECRTVEAREVEQPGLLGALDGRGWGCCSGLVMRAVGFNPFGVAGFAHVVKLPAGGEGEDGSACCKSMRSTVVSISDLWGEDC